jgi:peptidoglycan-associated lipoprotein
MASMSVSKWSIVLPVLLLTVNACHKRPPAIASTNPPATITKPVPPSSPRSSNTAVAGSEATTLTESQLFERMTLDQLNASQPLSDVFFEVDQNILRDDARQVLQRDAQWLSKWPQTKIRIDGHCDERGTSEYNLALGDRRAITVRDYLTNLGISPDRIQTVTLGRESPFCTSTGESCWAQNRRGHFVITAK